MIEQTEPLNHFVEQIRGADWIALDTEADSLHAYPEKICLLQIHHAGGNVLIDTLAKLDLEPLFEVLRGREIILHGADYDLRLLHRTYQFVPAKIFDTMTAARLLGFTEFGLTHLVARSVGVNLEKGPQKMNWAKRPLTERMEAYARNDTKYLFPLAQYLRGQLLEKNRLTWHEAVCARLIQDCSQPRSPDPDRVWRIKGSDRLSPAALAVLREAWRWREMEALQANKPPYFILSHELLVSISAAAAEGKNVAHLFPSFLSDVRRARLTHAVDRGIAILPEHQPQVTRTVGSRLSRAAQGKFDELKRIRDQRAGELGIDPSLIASRANLVDLARNPNPESVDLAPWQRQLLKDGGG